jgi:phage terminase small subunit
MSRKKDKAGRATDQNSDSTEGVRSVLKETKKEKKCTKMQKRFVKNHVQTGEVYKAAKRAGFACGSYGSALLKEPHIQTAIQQEMVRQGITDTLLSKKMKDGLNATYPAKFSTEGALLQQESPDMFTRKQYIDMILKVRGDYAPEKHQIESKTIVIHLNNELIKGLKDANAITEVEAEVLEAEIVDE